MRGKLPEPAAPVKWRTSRVPTGGRGPAWGADGPRRAPSRPAARPRRRPRHRARRPGQGRDPTWSLPGRPRLTDTHPISIPPRFAPTRRTDAGRGLPRTGHISRALAHPRLRPRGAAAGRAPSRRPAHPATARPDSRRRPPAGDGRGVLARPDPRRDTPPVPVRLSCYTAKHDAATRWHIGVAGAGSPGRPRYNDHAGAGIRLHGTVHLLFAIRKERST